MNRRTVAGCFATLLFLTVSSHSQTVDYQLYLEGIHQLATSIVLVEARPDFGSGVVFVVPSSDSASDGLAFVATAKHLLFVDSSGTNVFRSKDVLVHFNRRSGGTESTLYEPALVFMNADLMVLRPKDKRHPLREYDVGGMSLNAVSQPESVLVGQYVYIGGFPLGLGTSKEHLSPVVKSGIIAQVDRGTILVDITINRGNSGGGVYTIDKYRTAHLLGIVLGYPPTREFVLTKVEQRADGKLVTEYEGANSSLGIVTPLSLIQPHAQTLLEGGPTVFVP